MRSHVRRFCASSSLLRYEAGAYSLPHPRKNNGGEDSFFFANESSSRATLGVADGVSAAADGGLYAQSLMNAAAELAVNDDDPHSIMQSAWARVADVEGRSTACFASVAAGRLRWSNLGDSCCWVLRPRGARLSIAHRTKSQLHEWNCPFQLGRLGGTELNTPADAMSSSDEMALLAGDTVLLATDGLTDALHPLEILEIAHSARGQPAGHVARTLVETAIEMSKDSSRMSPIQQAMMREGYVARGRELQDDVTVVACRVIG